MKHEEFLDDFLHHFSGQFPELIIRIVLFIPDRYFYYPDILSDEFAGKRKQIRDIIQQKNSFAYRGDARIQAKWKQTVRDYEDELKILVATKKNDLALKLLDLSLEQQLQALKKLIIRYRLLGYIKQYYF